MRHRAGTQRFDDFACIAWQDIRCSSHLVQRIFRVDLQTELLRLRPVFTFTAGQAKQLRGQHLEALDVTSLRVDLKQFGADCQSLRTAAHGLLQNLFGLQIPPVGEIDVSLGHGIHISDGVELAERVTHRGRCDTGVARVDALPAAGTEE